MAGGTLPRGRSNQIHAFLQIRTNQVLYSAEPLLKTSALAQLPDIGANHTPDRLRKDMWQRFFVVNFGTSKTAARQQALVWRKLRELRRLHELYWQPTKSITEPHTEEEIEAIKERMEQRGGNKKETVYEYMARKKNLMKVREVQNQKANSVADLAACLSEQYNLDRQQEDYAQSDQSVLDAERKQLVLENTRWLKRYQRAKVILKMAEMVEKGAVEKLQAQVQAYTTELANPDASSRSMSLHDLGAARKQSQTKITLLKWAAGRVRDLRPQGREVSLADLNETYLLPRKTSEEVPRMRNRAEPEGTLATTTPAASESANTLGSATGSAAENTAQENTAQVEGLSPLQTFEWYREKLKQPPPAYPLEVYDDLIKAVYIGPTRLGPTKKSSLESRKPFYTNDSELEIQWTNPDDAGHAESWPERVVHTALDMRKRDGTLLRKAVHPAEFEPEAALAEIRQNQKDMRQRSDIQLRYDEKALAKKMIRHRRAEKIAHDNRELVERATRSVRKAVKYGQQQLQTQPI